MSDPWPGWEECGECSGSDCQHDGDHAGRDCEPCPDCALGYVPPAHQAEAAALEIHFAIEGERNRGWCESTARAALIAAARKDTPTTNRGD